jgi:hypothetical protein
MKDENKMVSFFQELRKANVVEKTVSKEGITKTVDSGKIFEKSIHSLLSLSFKEMTKVKVKGKRKVKNLDDYPFLIENKKKITSGYCFDEEINISEDQNNTFIYQPFGSQSFPDIIVFYEKKMFLIELKKIDSAKYVTLWNASLPKKNVIYILYRKGDHKRTFLLGQSLIVNESEYNALVEFAEKQRKEAKAAKSKLKSKEGFFPWFRQAFQRGKKGANDFSEDLMKSREQSVINFLDGKEDSKKDGEEKS